VVDTNNPNAEKKAQYALETDGDQCAASKVAEKSAACP
jgi:hypothetical protein